MARGEPREVIVRELVYAVLIIGSLLGLGAMSALSWEQGLQVSSGLILFGMILGVPTGVIYHVQLYRALAPGGVMSAGWYWNPMKYNKMLTDEQWGAVMPWCYAGAFGFVVIMGGIVALAIAVLSTWAQMSAG